MDLSGGELVRVTPVDLREHSVSGLDVARCAVLPQQLVRDHFLDHRHRSRFGGKLR